MAKIENTQPVSTVGAAVKAAIKNKSAASLPQNPSDRGFKATDIINMLYKPIIDTASSAISEIDRVVEEINK